MTSKKQIKQIRIIFYAIFCGLLLLGLGAVALVKGNGVFMPLTPIQMQYLETLVMIMAFGGIPAAHYFHKKKTESIHPDVDVVEKLSRYRVSFFIKMTIFEGVSLISLLAYVMSGINTFLIIFGCMMIVVLISYPSQSRIAEDLDVESAEIFE